MLIKVFGTDYFETTGIRLANYKDKIDDAEYTDRLFNSEDVESWRLLGEHGCDYEKAYFIYHCNKYEEDPKQYNKVFHECLDKGLKLKNQKEVTAHPHLAFMWHNIAGTKIIYGSGVSSYSPSGPGVGVAEREKVYTGSYDKAYYIWFKTQDEVAEEMNRQIANSNNITTGREQVNNG